MSAIKVWVVLACALCCACDSTLEATPCHDVPDGGCPLDNGANVCQDPSCNAAYACVDGGWVRTQVCPPHPHDAATPPADAGEGGSTFDVSIDVPPGGNGGPGCTDLELPDCPAAVGIACVQSPGCCGCTDLWVCDDGGWDLWGECADGGIVVQK
ncbi:MAG TPA: hypothetical protein VF765_03655 [Polyangiaceae bacterium]